MTTQVIFLGDSTTKCNNGMYLFSNWKAPMDGGLSGGLDYVSQVQTQMSSTYGKSIRVVNAGFQGVTALVGASRFGSDAAPYILSTATRYVWVLDYGINDMDLDDDLYPAYPWPMTAYIAGITQQCANIRALGFQTRSSGASALNSQILIATPSQPVASMTTAMTTFYAEICTWLRTAANRQALGICDIIDQAAALWSSSALYHAEGNATSPTNPSGWTGGTFPHISQPSGASPPISPTAPGGQDGMLAKALVTCAVLVKHV